MFPVKALILAIVSSLLTATVSAQSPINVIKTDRPVVALTFDDGPHEHYTLKMLELFAKENVRATFFEVGKNVTAHPELAKAVVEAGHEIGNHSKTHPRMSELGIEAIREEIETTQNIIREATGAAPKVFRAPFGAHGPELWTVLAEHKLPSVLSRLYVADWEKDITVDDIIERSSKAEAGDIILLHTWQVKTVEALPEIIRRLKAKGLEFVTVSELLALRQD